nr:hypothetical protein [Tanacetum cinerariifolium]
MVTNEDSSAAGSKPITLFIRTRPAESKIQATLLGLNSTFPFVEKIIKEYNGQRPTHIQEACFEHTKKCFEDRVIPFLDIFKIHVMPCEVTWFNEATEFNRIFDELDITYGKCFADNQSLYAMNKQNIARKKSLQIQKKNLLIHDKSLIADCIAKDKVCEQPNATASNAIFEINKLKAQLQEKDDTIRHLHAEKDILAEIATLKADAVGKKNSGPTGTPTKSKVLALGMYAISSKYIPPQKRADWVQPTLLPKKKQVTFLEPHRTSPRSTQKPPVQHKKPTVPVNMFPKPKPTTEARKPIPKRNTQNYNPLPAKSVKAKRAADYYRNLYNATKNTVTRIVPIWKPTGRRFNIHDIFGSRKSTEPIVKPLKLTPCVSPSTNATLSLEPILEPVELSSSVSSCASLTITMVSRFSDYRLSYRKAGVNLLTSASGLQPQGNTKKDRIQQTQSRAKNNKLKDHPRTVRPSLNNKKSVV